MSNAHPPNNVAVSATTAKIHAVTNGYWNLQSTCAFAEQLGSTHASHAGTLTMNNKTENGGFYFLLGALAVAVAVMFVVFSGHHSLVGSSERDMMGVETPHAALDLPQPPVMRVKYQSKICSPVQNKTPSCLPA
jgi:hypothetical protein